MPPHRVAIIGGGPSALVTLKTLLELQDRKGGAFDVDATLFEGEEQIGGTFRYRSYANGSLVSSKQLTCFSDFRMPLDSSDHMTLPAYVQYLEDYVAHFRLRQRATFRMSTRVRRVRRADGGGHIVRWRQRSGEEDEAHFDYVAVCAGLHVEPAFPSIPGLADPQLPSKWWDEKKEERKEKQKLSDAQRRIQTLHSSAYKDPEFLKDKSVLVCGTGETGMDLAYAAVKAPAKSIVLSTRDGFLSFPHVLQSFSLFGVTYDKDTPIDGLITNLFETTHRSRLVEASRLRWHVSDFGVKLVLKFLTGTSAGCNQWCGELPEHKQGRAYVFLNKSAKAMPYLNREWKNRSWLMERIAKYIDPPSVRDDEPGISLAPFPEYVDEDGRVVFRENGRKEAARMRNRIVKPDIVLFATGYRHSFPWLDSSYATPLDEDSNLCRGLFAYDDPTLTFSGFVRPGVGAIPPQAEMEARLWCSVICGEVPAPTSEAYYKLLQPKGARITHGVDYSSYVSQLARDVGSQPGLLDLWRTHGFDILLIYCFAAAFPTLYSLTGPWASAQAPHITRTEIRETIARRGVGGNVLMGVIPMVFYGFVNLAALLLEQLLNVAQALMPKTCQAAARQLGWTQHKKMA